MDDLRIRDLEQLEALWLGIYDGAGRVDYRNMLPYYAEDIHFRDSVQELRGMRAFRAMTERLARRSKQLRFIIHSGLMEGDRAFIEWEMVITYKKFPSASVHGASRLRLRDGKIAEQRDYYDLWGDIFDRIPLWSRAYRRFMKRSFG